MIFISFIMDMKTNRLVIRDLIYQDYKGYYSIYCDTEVARNAGIKRLESLSDSRIFVLGLLSSPNTNIYTIIKNEDNTIIGTLSSFYVNHYSGIEIGYAIKKNEQHNGYAREAISEYLKNIRNKRSVSFVQALIEKNNYASINLINSLGFKNITTFINRRNQMIHVYRFFL